MNWPCFFETPLLQLLKDPGRISFYRIQNRNRMGTASVNEYGPEDAVRVAMARQ